MSVQKLVAEADKFFEKGKVPEGIAKLKAALSSEPLNQIVATKLAGIYVQNSEPLEAAKVFSGLAKRLSDAGKSSIAIAIYKQALEFTPDDMALRLRYAIECEAAGKLGDAFLQSQIVLNYYLRRKKYFDASNVLPVMARSQPKDDKIKSAWIEVMQLCQAEQKLVSLIVALCGPPGVVASEFPVGGDPVTLAPALYESLKKLIPYFPRDGKIVYALAWCAYRRGRKSEMYHFLHECLRREPDFCLAILLFARVLAEDQKLNESVFVFRYYKERMASDKNADMLTLNRLLEAFVEKNGWIKFTEDSGDLLDAAGFLKSMTGVEKAALTHEKEIEEQRSRELQQGSSRADLELLPAEIEIGGLNATSDSLEILNSTGQSIQEASKQQKKPLPSGLSEPMRMQAELIKATVEAAVAGMGNATPQPAMVQPVVLPAIQASSIQGFAEANSHATLVQALVQASAEQATIAAKSNTVAPAVLDLSPPEEVVSSESIASPVAEGEPTGKVEGFDGESVEFTSLIKRSGELATELHAPAAAEALPTDPAMVQPLPVGEIGANPTSEVPIEELEELKAPQKKFFNPLEQAILPGMAESGPPLEIDGRDESTQMFSPIDVLDAVKVKQNLIISNVDTKKTVRESPFEEPNRGNILADSSLTVEDVKSEADNPKWRQLAAVGENTIAYSPVEAVQAATDSRRPRESAIPPYAPVLKGPDTVAPGAEISASGDATLVMQRPQPGALPELNPISLAEHSNIPAVSIDPGGDSEGPAFMPIPYSAGSNKPGAESDQVDLGDDLLEGATRIFTPQAPGDKTEHLLKEIKHDFKNAAGDRISVEALLKKAERFTAKRNYYLARKAIRHAQALGADEEVVKGRLREIRKLEFPEGLYNTMSSDLGSNKVDTSDVLERLELEFDLTEATSDLAEMGAIVERRIESILQENDARTVLDFGVGLHEMGLFRQAEALFIRVVEEFPDHAFDAYYLAAVSKLSRRDYAGAVSILKRLSSDLAKTDLEKIQIYYALGETFEKMRQLERSKKFFKKVAELDANYRNIRHKLEE